MLSGLINDSLGGGNRRTLHKYLNEENLKNDKKRQFMSLREIARFQFVSPVKLPANENGTISCLHEQIELAASY